MTDSIRLGGAPARSSSCAYFFRWLRGLFCGWERFASRGDRTSGLKVTLTFLAPLPTAELPCSSALLGSESSEALVAATPAWATSAGLVVETTRSFWLSLARRAR